MLRRCLPFLAALSVLVPVVAGASPLIEIAGPIGGNAGLQPVASGPGAASTYFNPALLADAEDELMVAFALISEQVGVTLDGRRGGDVPLSVAGRDVLVPDPSSATGYRPLPNSVVPTQWLQLGCPAGSGPNDCPSPGFAARPRQQQGSSGKTRTYLALGLVKHLVKDRLALGIYTMVPLTSFTTAQAFFADEREALFTNSLHPELYGDRLTAVSVVFGLGLKIVPELSVGAGLSLSLANTATSADYIQNASDYSTLLLNNSITTSVSLSPTMGASYQPAPWFRLAGAVHAPESFSIDTAVVATLPSGTTSGTQQNNVFDWMPWSAGLGAEAHVLGRGPYTMTVVGSVNYAWWSAYQDRQGTRPSSYGPGLAWTDTLSGALGTRHTYGSVRGFVDFRYVPSPVPEQVGRSNYVDNDRVGAALGADFSWQIGPVQLRPGAQFFVDRLLQRHNTKDDARITDELPDGSIFGSTHAPVPGTQGLQTNNPGWPGFASAGWIWGGAVTLSTPL
jgi:hypothetical protein